MSVFRRCLDGRVRLLGVFQSRKWVDQLGDVLGAVLQSGRDDGDDVEPVVQVLPEDAFLDGSSLEVPVRGGDDPDVDVDRFGSPTRSNAISWSTRNSLVCTSR